MKKRLLLSTLIICIGILFFGVLSVSATVVNSGTCGTNVQWALDDEGTLTISGTGDMKDYSSGGSAPWFSKRSSIKKLVIENGITSIGSRTFTLITGITELEIPDSVTSIGDYAFSNCTGLKNISLGKGVKTIGVSAFGACTELIGFSASDSLEIIGDAAFGNCDKLEYVHFGNNLKSIGFKAFSGCENLGAITIPDSVTNIDEQAFSWCEKVASIKIGKGISTIGVSTFSYCFAVEEVTIETGVTAISDNAFYRCDGLKNVYYTGTQSQWNEIVISSVGNDNLTSATITYVIPLVASGVCGENVTYKLDEEGTLTISGTGDMYHWSSTSPSPWSPYNNTIKKIIIEDNITNIGAHSFTDCVSLTDVDITDDIVNVGAYSFRNCKSLMSIIIPKSTTRIESGAFYNCISLTDVTLFESVENIGNSAFSGCTNLANINIPKSVTNIENSAFSNCSNLTSIDIPEGITSIKNGTFSGCSKLNSIAIPKSVTNIGDSALSYTALSEIYIAKNIENIGHRAFEHCMNLKSITVDDDNAYYSSDMRGTLFNKDKTVLIQYPIGSTFETYSIPDGVISIEYSAFCAGIYLKYVDIPKSVTTINSCAFSECYNLKNLKIYPAVKIIDNSAFSGCYSYDTTYYYGTESQWKDIVIGNTNTLFTNNVVFVKYTKTKISDDKKSFIVEPINIDEGKTVIIALYKNDDFVEMQSKIYKLENLEFTTTKTYDTVKIMVWENFEDLIPITIAETIELS
ncbi:MAG: leucine-rich repeat domain-containing protein [Ruminococcaceae bacterium]|nr:leucine-rich repeat domain-containing protein [Oscillospiraceae bacterium]